MNELQISIWSNDNWNVAKGATFITITRTASGAQCHLMDEDYRDFSIDLARTDEAGRNDLVSEWFWS
jgi:hypothetical protein